MALTQDDPNDERQALEQGAIVRVLTIGLPKVPFVAQDQDPTEARARLSIDLATLCALQPHRRRAAPRSTRCPHRVLAV